MHPEWMSIPEIERLEKPRGCPVIDRKLLRGVALWTWGEGTDHEGFTEIYVTHPPPSHVSRRKSTDLFIDLEETLGFIIAFRLGAQLLPTQWAAEFDRLWHNMNDQSNGYEIVSRKILGENPGQFRARDRYVLAVALNNMITWVDRLSGA